MLGFSAIIEWASTQTAGWVAGFFLSGFGPSSLGVAPPMLAAISVSDGIQIVNVLSTIVLAIYLNSVATKANKFDTLEKKLDAKTDQLVDTKFDQQSGTLKAEMRVLTAALQRVEHRLDKQDEQYQSLNEKTFSIRLGEAMKDGDMQVEFLKTFATKEDVDLLGQRIDRMKDALLKRYFGDTSNSAEVRR